VLCWQSLGVYEVRFTCVYVLWTLHFVVGRKIPIHYLLPFHYLPNRRTVTYVDVGRLGLRMRRVILDNE
jgi:hypothetical protein